MRLLLSKDVLLSPKSFFESDNFDFAFSNGDFLVVFWEFTFTLVIVFFILSPIPPKFKFNLNAGLIGKGLAILVSIFSSFLFRLGIGFFIKLILSLSLSIIIFGSLDSWIIWFVSLIFESGVIRLIFSLLLISLLFTILTSAN